MLNKVKVASLVLVASSVFSVSAFAGLVSLNEVTDYYIADASAVTAYEVQNSVYEDILNTAHKIDVEQLDVETRVLITDNRKMDNADTQTSE